MKSNLMTFILKQIKNWIKLMVNVHIFKAFIFFINNNMWYMRYIMPKIYKQNCIKNNLFKVDPLKKRA